MTSGYLRMIQAVVQLAEHDLKSTNPTLRQEAEEFLAPGGGKDQWKKTVMEALSE